jgi:hypothetical protein
MRSADLDNHPPDRNCTFLTFLGSIKNHWEEAAGCADGARFDGSWPGQL